MEEKSDKGETLLTRQQTLPSMAKPWRILQSQKQDNNYIMGKVIQIKNMDYYIIEIFDKKLHGYIILDPEKKGKEISLKTNWKKFQKTPIGEAGFSIGVSIRGGNVHTFLKIRCFLSPHYFSEFRIIKVWETIFDIFLKTPKDPFKTF